MVTTYIKKFGIGLAVATLMLVNAPAAYAATDQAVLDAADAGTDYLATQQLPDGSIDGFGGETDWTIVAVAADGIDPAEAVSSDGNSLVDAIKADPLDSSASASTVGRRILAIAAAGEDTANFDGVNYNQLLADQHVDGQIGDTAYINDDTFGLMAIAVTDDEALKPAAQDALDYILANQDVSGGFGWAALSDPSFSGPDSNDTAAAIVAIQTGKTIGLTNPTIGSALDGAVVYLLSMQDASGGFLYDKGPFTFGPDPASTSWGLIALNTFGELYKTQMSAARDWLLAHQNKDGGFGYMPGTSDTFTTPHAILALLGTTWTLGHVLPPATLAPAPVVTLPAPVVVAATTKKPVYVPTAAAYQAVQGSTVVTPQVSSISTPPAQNTANKTDAKSVTKSNTSRFIGYSLMAVAIVGFIAYALRVRNRQSM